LATMGTEWKKNPIDFLYPVCFRVDEKMGG